MDYKCKITYEGRSARDLKAFRERLRRWGVGGDQLTKVQQWGARVCPPSFEPLLMFAYVSLVFLMFGRGRRAVVENICVILPDSTRLGNWFRAWKVFWNFGWTMTDAGRVRAGMRDLAWVADGAENLRRLAEMEGGAILLTAHMGNYDIAGSTFAGKFNRKLNTVRAPERNDDLHDYYQGKGDRQAREDYEVCYNSPGSMLGVDLAKMLGRGELVALQGDRVIAEIAPLETQVCGRQIPLPVGPHVLSLAADVPIFPLFVVRAGWRRYKVICLPALPPLRRVRGVPKSDLIRGSTDAWALVLSGILQEHWDQWLQFEPAFCTEAIR